MDKIPGVGRVHHNPVSNQLIICIEAVHPFALGYLISALKNGRHLTIILDHLHLNIPTQMRNKSDAFLRGYFTEVLKEADGFISNN